MKTFGWDICYECNYRCPYCGIWENSSGKKLDFSAEKWGIIWRKIAERYGRCRIFMSGGEPSVYPDFYRLVRMLSEFHHPDICTNLSWDVDRVISEISPERLTISPTYHPAFADFEEFVEKAVKIRQYLPMGQVYHVAHPGQIKMMKVMSLRLKSEGIRLIPLPLRGDGYVINSEDEKKIIEELSPYRGSEKLEYQLQNVSPLGKLCRAGMDYAVIRIDGGVDRCSQYRTASVGRIYEDDFSLFEAPRACEKKYCPIESNWIVEEN